MSPDAVVLLEEPGVEGSVLGPENDATAAAAEEAGWRVVRFSSNYDLLGDADEALEGLGRRAGGQGVWLGFIPSPERYREVYEAALRRGVRLLNDPEQHLLAMEFDRFYPRLVGLTPESRVLRSVEGCEEAASELGLPLFVKGALQSAKHRGWKACVADSGEELRGLVGQVLGSDKARGRAVVRKLVALRHLARTERGFPRGREFRFFVHEGEVLGGGYYWPDDDALAGLDEGERAACHALARQAAGRLGVPWLAVDVGQLDDGSWIVIEVGDPQFAGFSRAPRAEIFRALRGRLCG